MTLFFYYLKKIGALLCHSTVHSVFGALILSHLKIKTLEACELQFVCISLEVRSSQLSILRCIEILLIGWNGVIILSIRGRIF